MSSASSPIAIASPAPTSSIGSPCPTLAPRASPAVQSPVDNPGIITHKEWIVPPRPKPGRKPATDTPPTKRKAQNRAAQRAFRERRAARVNELEERLKEVGSETEQRLEEYKVQIALLTKNNADLAQQNSALKLENESLRQDLAEVKSIKSISTSSAPSPQKLTQVASPAPSSEGAASTPCGGDCSCSDAIDKVLCDRPFDPSLCSICREPSCNCIKTPTSDPSDSSVEDKKPLTIDTSNEIASQSKRATSPIIAPVKRGRFEHLSDYETDFTTAYLPRRGSAMSTISHISAMPDPCGFCSDGTPCVCAEMASAMDMEDSEDEEGGMNMKLAPILGSDFGMQSPPKWTIDDPIPLTLKRMIGLDKPLMMQPSITRPPRVIAPRNKSSGCKPGGCAQCKADPMSTLFCQSVATRMTKSTSSGATASAAASTPAGCCGGGGRAGGCCKDIENAVETPATAAPSVPLPRRKKAAPPAQTLDSEKTYIPCSAAYQTLSRHRAFDEAAADLGALVRPLVIQSMDGSCPQVEVSSVRDVLKMMDRKFGRDKG
ncbi:hypothetical protein BZA77DRAFT_311439 [Pyronema omphalodes]|nr:hypothetical protein BZA77DRAFT_311439 [Pyronema omphalodes]